MNGGAVVLRFGNLRFDGVVEPGETGARLVNIGDAAELLAIDRLYQHMGITDIISVGEGCYETDGYSGEYVVVPVNAAVVPDGMCYNMLHFLDRIIPVYLGLALMNLNVSEEQLDYLKRFEPIGCRDERTMCFLREKGISAYLFGCIVATYPKTDIPLGQRKTVFFVDVPKSIVSHIPAEIRSKITFFDHEFNETLETWGTDSGKSRAWDTIQKYKTEARLIVTSRFHAAVLGLALGIPTIVTLENRSFKWSWLEKYLPIYTPDRFNEIDWKLDSVDFEPVKEQMITVAKRRIRETYEKYADLYSLSYLHENSMRCDEPNLLYYTSALMEVKRRWEEIPERSYILWGTAENARRIYQYITEKYPEAELIKVYDYYSPRKEFHGITTVVPTIDECLADKDIFTIVTSNSAKGMAEDLFNQIGKEMRKYIQCSLDFLSNEDLKTPV